MEKLYKDYEEEVYRMQKEDFHSIKWPNISLETIP